MVESCLANVEDKKTRSVGSRLEVVHGLLTCAVAFEFCVQEDAECANVVFWKQFG